ncbi:MAG: DUF1822 family protein [Halothece sp.]
MLSLEQLSQAYSHSVWIKILPEHLESALPKKTEYSNETAYHRAFLNRLCLSLLLPVFQEEIKASVEVFPNETALTTIWEFVTGFAVTLNQQRLVIIPSTTIDTDELCVPQEWVDIPNWVGDYYLGVQVNLDDGWLRVWGYTTHEQLKTQGSYDGSDLEEIRFAGRTYSLDSEDIFDEIEALWLSLSLCASNRVEIAPIAALSSSQINRFLKELSQPSLYSPRLNIPFPLWAAMVESDSLRQQLYQQRIGITTATQEITKERFSQLWASIQDIVNALSLNLATVRMASRSGNNKPHKLSPEVSRGRVVDLGIQLAGHPVALLVYCTQEEANKYELLFQVHPGGGHPYLPPEVQLIILDEDGEVFLEAKSRTADNWIQLAFRGEPGERFSVKVALGEAEIVEQFVI